jgi:DNA-binding MarR family transcriptional regulator
MVGTVTDWTFLTNHALVLICVARDSNFRLRDIAECVGITERATHRIVSELEQAGYLTRHRMGRRTFYEVHPDVPLRHPLLSDRDLGELLAVLVRKKGEEVEDAA